tara:strand:+ start:254 stop:394 length:141 start_codon:yes stop_codon:yes gene_type:complete
MKAKITKVENLMIILASTIIVPLWTVVMYEGVVKGGFKALDSIIIT